MTIRRALSTTFAMIAASLPWIGHAATNYSFVEGVDGYSGTTSVQINEGLPDTGTISSAAPEDRLSADRDNEDFNDAETQVLIRFDGIVGGSGIPTGATVSSATLQVFTKSSSDGPVTIGFLSQGFTTSSTWNSLGGGATTAFTEDTASNLPDESSATFDVTQGVRNIVNGGANNGWGFFNASDDGWDFCSELPTCAQLTIAPNLKPLLTVTVADTPPTAATPVPSIGVWGLLLLAATVPLIAVFQIKKRS